MTFAVLEAGQTALPRLKLSFGEVNDRTCFMEFNTYCKVVRLQTSIYYVVALNLTVFVYHLRRRVPLRVSPPLC